MTKRINLSSMINDAGKRKKIDGPSVGSSSNSSFRPPPGLGQPCKIEHAIASYLLNCRTLGRKKAASLPVVSTPLEIEGRLGILNNPVDPPSGHPARILSSGAKPVGRGGELATAFYVNIGGGGGGRPMAPFVGGISHGHAVHWTSGGLSEAGPIPAAFGVTSGGAKEIKGSLEEVDMVETVYGGYQNSRRVAFSGLPTASSKGKMERKEKLCPSLDLCLPCAPYDFRIGCAAEETDEGVVNFPPPPGHTTRRIKRRRSYTRRDKSFFWRLDVTEVTTDDSETLQEVEMELTQEATVKLINTAEGKDAHKMAHTLASQLRWMVDQLNPAGAGDAGSVEERIEGHPDKDAVSLALAQLGALRSFGRTKDWRGAIGPTGGPTSNCHHDKNLKFIGCMPINFGRHNISDVQSGEGDYFISEKTDGVRYLMVFTGSTVVLVDRAMKGHRPIGGGGGDPFSYLLPLIRPGTVLDGEVVLNRKYRRAIFIVFDVMCVGAEKPVVDLNFSERLRHLRQASFRTPTAKVDMFGTGLVKDQKIACPLVRKNFVKRIDLDDLMKHVQESKGLRTYVNGDSHVHMTDGIIFQPDRPYAMGTDVNLFKWKYLDTVTIDVEILPAGGGYLHGNSDDGGPPPLRVACVGDEGSLVDMTRHIRLPPAERMRLEADRSESGAKIAEVGFDPETGEWYYLTMRPDKVASNHISTVLGTILELAEGMGTVELRYRMSVMEGVRDTYRKEVRTMQMQLLEHQRKRKKDLLGKQGRK